MHDHWKTLARLLGAPGAAEPPDVETEADSEAQPAADRSPARVEPVKPAAQSGSERAAAAPPSARPAPPQQREQQEAQSHRRPASPHPLDALSQTEPQARVPGFEPSEPAAGSPWDELVESLGVQPADRPAVPPARSAPTAAEPPSAEAPSAEPFSTRRQSRQSSGDKPDRGKASNSGFGSGLGLVPTEEQDELSGRGDRGTTDRPAAPRRAAENRGGREEERRGGDRPPRDRQNTRPSGEAADRPAAVARAAETPRPPRAAETARGSEGDQEGREQGGRRPRAGAEVAEGGEREPARGGRRGRRRGQRQRISADEVAFVADEFVEEKVEFIEPSFAEEEDRPRRRGAAADLDQRIEDETVDEDLEDAPQAADALAGDLDEDGVPRRRRRRRRRRRGTGGERTDAGEPVEGQVSPTATDVGQPPERTTPSSAIEATFDDDHEDAEEVAELRRGRRRRRPRRGGGEATEETPAQADLGDTAAVAPRRQPAARETAQRQDDVADEPLVVKQRDVPTWDETVDLLISANMESRRRDPRGPRGRSGGGRGGNGGGRRRD